MINLQQLIASIAKRKNDIVSLVASKVPGAKPDLASVIKNSFNLVKANDQDFTTKFTDIVSKDLPSTADGSLQDQIVSLIKMTGPGDIEPAVTQAQTEIHPDDNDLVFKIIISAVVVIIIVAFFFRDKIKKLF